MLIHVSPFALIFLSFNLLGQDTIDLPSVYFINDGVSLEKVSKQVSDKNELRVELRQLFEYSKKENLTFSFIKYEQEYLLFSVSKSNSLIHLITFNPEIVSNEDVDWRFLNRIYTFDDDFKLLAIATFKGALLLDLEKVFYLNSEYYTMDLPTDKLSSNHISSVDLIEELSDTILLNGVQAHNTSEPKLLLDGGCKNLYLRLLAEHCK